MDMRDAVVQLGVLRRSQLGLTAEQARRAVAVGDLRRIRHGWYATAQANPMVERAVAAGGCLTCISALSVFGAWTPLTDRLHLRYSRQAQRRGAAALPACRYPVDLPVAGAIDEPLVAWRGALTCVDDESAVALTDSALRQRLISESDLQLLPGEMRDFVDPRAEAGTESLVRFRLQKLGISVTPQVQIPGVGRVDLLVGDRLILECDSVSFHTDSTTYRKDRRRDRASVSQGYIVIRLTWEDVMFHWDEVLPDILAVVRQDRHRRRAR